MFFPEAQNVLGTATSTFNNAALASPWFVQLALIGIPLFAIAWFTYAEVMSRIAPDVKKRPLAIRAWVFFGLALWAAFGMGNFAVARELSTLVEFIVPAILFFASAFAANAAVKLGAVPQTGLSKLTRVALVAALIVAVGFFGARNFYGAFLPISALIAGFLTGFYSARYAGKTSAQAGYPFVTSSLLMLTGAACILMQPELFRFGQLGNLDLLQLAGFALVAVLAPQVAILSVMARVKRSKGFLNRTAHDRVMWLLRLGVLLCMVLFFITESIVTFGILSLSVVPLALVSGGHQPYSEAKIVMAFVLDLWSVLLFVFGLVAGSYALAFLAIILLRCSANKSVMAQAKRLL
ncbi:MAG: hypothetical protein FWD33_01425 [Alphaproteobacteria bacterium]|nr:hypothetical protein [Alphaproteobacteria bacterium]